MVDAFCGRIADDLLTNVNADKWALFTSQSRDVIDER